ncbi:MAG: M48 family metallopeptidase [Clostridia bacterium]|nr:M48 family metallopeptidase [Clostridia bacterium]
MKIEYQIIKSDRRSMAIEIKESGVIVRAPKNASGRQIKKFVEEHEDWIIKNTEKLQKRLDRAENFPIIGENELKILKKQAAEYIPHRVNHYAAIMGVEYGRIAIRSQKTKWGSCSGKQNLNFNCLLMLAPPQVIDSVVVHELCHLKQMNHSPAFYAEVLKYFPDYHKWDRWLKENGAAILSRVS